MRSPALASLLLASSALAAAAARQDGPPSFEALRRRFDADGDGQVSAAEFTRNKLAFRRLDRNGDGFLTEADFAGGGKPEPKPAAPASTPASPGTPAASASPESLEFFEKEVRPVLAGVCFECHSATAKKLKGGLRADSREALLAGGNSGPALVPGDPDASLIVQAVRYGDEDLQMPPKQRLPDGTVRAIERWVSMGAPWPASEGGAPAAAAGKREIDFETARAFWAFRPPARPETPATKDEAWPWSPIDRFLLAAMEARGAKPVADAERRTWIRRASFDLTGLPPTPEEIAAFVGDRSPGAFEAVVDRLLASKAYGERWGRHWLDVARYAESSGKDSNVLYPHAWRYRDWVIASFERDEPYDRFLREQIAGDLLPSQGDDQRAAQLVATGYLALGAKGHNTRDRRQFAFDVADEQIDSISQGMLGLTVACARCHDHKFDPIPTEDYYALAGILLSTETRYGTFRGPGNNHPSELIALPSGARVPDGPKMSRQQRAQLERAREGAERLAEEEAGKSKPKTGGDGTGGSSGGSNGGSPSGSPSGGDGGSPSGGDGRKRPDPQDLVRSRLARQQAEIFESLLSRFDADGNPLPSNRLAMGAAEGRPRDVPVLDRGELDKAGAVVKRGFLRVLDDGKAPRIGKGSGRAELADWIASASNPLTARVWANRVWLNLFGRGIVSTPDNFGAAGARPEHPDLLDWLATELVANGWSTKKLVRSIVLSHAYRLAAADDAKNLAADPEVLTLWRMPARRLEAEAIRDAMLFAAGRLETTPPVGSPVGALEGALRREELMASATQDRPVRSVYLSILRDHLPDALEVFDAPDASFVIGDREETNVATQALYLMNDEDVLATADAFAARLLSSPGNDDARVELAFELALGREPDGTEKEAARRFLKEFPKLAPREPAGRDGRRGDRAPRLGLDADRAPAQEPQRAAWSAFAQTLFQTAEFRYR